MSPLPVKGFLPHNPKVPTFPDHPLNPNVNPPASGPASEMMAGAPSAAEPQAACAWAFRGPAMLVLLPAQGPPCKVPVAGIPLPLALGALVVFRARGRAGGGKPLLGVVAVGRGRFADIVLVFGRGRRMLPLAATGVGPLPLAVVAVAVVCGRGRVAVFVPVVGRWRLLLLLAVIGVVVVGTGVLPSIAVVAVVVACRRGRVAVVVGRGRRMLPLAATGVGPLPLAVVAVAVACGSGRVAVFVLVVGRWRLLLLLAVIGVVVVGTGVLPSIAVVAVVVACGRGRVAVVVGRGRRMLPLAARALPLAVVAVAVACGSGRVAVFVLVVGRWRRLLLLAVIGVVVVGTGVLPSIAVVAVVVACGRAKAAVVVPAAGVVVVGRGALLAFAVVVVVACGMGRFAVVVTGELVGRGPLLPAVVALVACGRGRLAVGLVLAGRKVARNSVAWAQAPPQCGHDRRK